MNNTQTQITKVPTEALVKLWELSEALLRGDHSRRIVVDFDDSLITKIADNLNQFLDSAQLNAVGEEQQQTINSFIEVISSFANLDFKRKLPISENGTVIDAIATGINILGEELEQSTTSKQEVEKERNQLNEAQALAKVGSWELDIATLTLSGSKEAYRIFDLDPHSESTLLDQYQERIHPDDLAMLDNYITRSMQHGENFVVEHRILDREGVLKFIFCVGELIPNRKGKPVMLKGTIQDITERKVYEEKLKEAKEYAEEANTSKSRFLANMSHEIRTPLNGILGLTEVMIGENVSEEHRKYLKIIREAGKNLSQLINDILDLSKIESKKLTLESIPFDFDEVVRSNIEAYRLLADQKGLAMFLDIDSSIPEKVIGDPTRLCQVLTNLVGNAIKFTDKGSVSISFEMLRADDKELWVQGSVIDTGVGIPEEKLEMIFQSFTQADETVSRKYGGTGLGLSIVKNLLIQMKGGISVQRKQGREQGAAFVFSFRLELPPPEKKKEEVLVQQAERRRFAHAWQILVVDDSQLNLLVAKKMLSNLGAQVVTANSGKEAIEMVNATAYDLVLMDIQMPDLNGYETTAHLRQLNYNGPIVALSANAYEEDVQASLAMGMNDHITKPYTEEHLFEKIQELMEGKQ